MGEALNVGLEKYFVKVLATARSDKSFDELHFVFTELQLEGKEYAKRINYFFPKQTIHCFLSLRILLYYTINIKLRHKRA